METLLAILMRRDGLDRDEAQDMIDEARDLVKNGANPEEILHYEFGLEPDYMFELL